MGFSGRRGLGARERQILDLLLDNLASKEFASRLNVSEKTVKFHVSNLLAKYGLARASTSFSSATKSVPPPGRPPGIMRGNFMLHSSFFQMVGASA
jgi:DNA-binding CsgD family transcriptional regulator